MAALKVLSLYTLGEQDSGDTGVSSFVQIPRVVDGGVTATGVLSRQRGNLITIGNTQ